MKLLLENWNKYLVNEVLSLSYYDEPMSAVEQANYDFIMQEIEKNPLFAQTLLSKVLDSVEPTPEEDLVEGLVREAPPLNTEIISSLAGVGTKGIVFRLKNGNILKIYSSGYLDQAEFRLSDPGWSNFSTGEKEEQFYASEKSKMFSGDGSVSTLPIYDQGTFDLFEAKIKFVEMAEVMPFDKYLEFTGRSYEGDFDKDDYGDILTAITAMKRVMIMYKRPGHYGTQEPRATRAERLEDAIMAIKKSKLTGPEAKGIANMLKYVITKYSPDYLQDFHAGNFGVVRQTIATNKPAFVLFDP